jgi:hypothetical protein
LRPIFSDIKRAVLAQTDNVPAFPVPTGGFKLGRDLGDGRGVTASIHVVLWRAMARCV